MEINFSISIFFERYLRCNSLGLAIFHVHEILDFIEETGFELLLLNRQLPRETRHRLFSFLDLIIAWITNLLDLIMDDKATFTKYSPVELRVKLIAAVANFHLSCTFNYFRINVFLARS